VLYRFLAPAGYGEAVQVIVNATGLQEAVEKFMRHPKRPREGSFGVWKRGRLVAEVGSRWSPVTGEEEFECHAIERERGVGPSEN
jgi:hypothetical protein